MPPTVLQIDALSPLDKSYRKADAGQYPLGEIKLIELMAALRKLEAKGQASGSDSKSQAHGRVSASSRR